MLLKASSLAYDESIYANPPGAAAVSGIREIGYDPATIRSIQTGAGGFDIDACYLVERDDSAILAFRGTLPPTQIFNNPQLLFQVLFDWLNDGNIDLTKGAHLAGSVHRGFLRSLDALWSHVESFVAPVGDAGKPLYVTGHSKGGGLAYLAAYRLLEKLALAPQALYSFAAPRVGDAAFASAFDNKITKAYRVEFQDDLVPHLPPDTGAWLDQLPSLRKIADKFPHQAPHVENGAAAAEFERLAAKITGGLLPYSSAGALQFYDWTNQLQHDSFDLKLKRECSLALKLLDPVEVVNDHTIGGLAPNPGRGYKSAVC